MLLMIMRVLLQIKSLIYELANIVELFQPVEYCESETLYKRLKDLKELYD